MGVGVGWGGVDGFAPQRTISKLKLTLQNSETEWHENTFVYLYNKHISFRKYTNGSNKDTADFID